MRENIVEAVNAAFLGLPVDAWQRLFLRISGALGEYVPEEDIPEVLEKIVYHGRQVSNIWEWELQQKGRKSPDEWDRLVEIHKYDPKTFYITSE
jgi:hypothetical protein